MRRTTATTIVEQARLLHSLLTSSPESSLMHHFGDLEQYFRLLSYHCEITHSVSPRFPDKNHKAFSDYHHLLYSTGNTSTVIQNMAPVQLILEDIIERKIRIAPRPDW